MGEEGILYKIGYADQGFNRKSLETADESFPKRFEKAFFLRCVFCQFTHSKYVEPCLQFLAGQFAEAAALSHNQVDVLKELLSIQLVADVGKAV